MEVVNIKDNVNLVRDLESKAILTTNTNAMERYQQQTRLFSNKQKQDEDIKQLKHDVNEIKDLLRQLLNK